jgi:hypothetical protein
VVLPASEPTIVTRHLVSSLGLSLLLLTFLAQPALAQKPKKAPPTEVERQAVCAALPEVERRTTDFCKTEEERREDAQEQRRKELQEKEKPTRTSFLRKLHLDGLWIPTSTGTGQYGLIGTHIDVASAGRLHFYGPPGMMLVLEKTDGGWRVKPAMTWGVSVFIGEVRLPGQKENAQLFFNLTKSWSAGSFQAGRDMAGLSLTWKNK